MLFVNHGGLGRIPCDDFERDLRQLPHACLRSVHTLRSRYEASIDATIYRMVDFETRIPFAALFLTDQKKHFTGDGPLWVNNSSRNSWFRPFIWPGTIPPFDSEVHNCMRNGVDTPDWVAETWFVKGEPNTWLVQAARLPEIRHAPTYSKVVALLLTKCTPRERLVYFAMHPNVSFVVNEIGVVLAKDGARVDVRSATQANYGMHLRRYVRGKNRGQRSST